MRHASWFWRRQDATLAGIDEVGAGTESKSSAVPWYRPTLLESRRGRSCEFLQFCQPARHGQFGIDTAAILAALSKMQSLMNTYIAAPLKTINQYEQSTAKYEQEVMYPLAAINQAKTSVMQFENQFSQVSGMFRSTSQAPPCRSRKISKLILLSRNAANVRVVISPVSERVWRRDAPECGVPAVENDDRHDGCAGAGRDEAGDRNRCPRGCGA